jgi:hypothetical protein
LLATQCIFIYSTASFLSKLRSKKVEKLHNSSFYRNFRKLNTGIGFRNRERLFPALALYHYFTLTPCYTYTIILHLLRVTLILTPYLCYTKTINSIVYPSSSSVYSSIVPAIPQQSQSAHYFLIRRYNIIISFKFRI